MSQKKLVIGTTLLFFTYLVIHRFNVLSSRLIPTILQTPNLNFDIRLQSCNDPLDTSVVFIVDQYGFGDFYTVQGAIDAVPDYNQVPVLILINNGTFTEKVLIPRTKPLITLQGQGMNLTFIAWNDTAKSSGRTYNSASVSVEATDFIAKNISFMNTSPGPSPGVEGAQAVAVRVSGDKAAFYGCGFFGYQDTLFDDQGRHYFKECFIQGSIDYICGSGRSLYEDCELHSVAQPSKKISGAITAQRRLKWSEPTAFSFVNCRITGTGNILLGRAWGPFSRVVFARTYMDNIVHPQGWDDWGDPDRTMTVVYGEYECTGPGANRGKRVNWSHDLLYWEAYPFLSTLFIDGDEWLPAVHSTNATAKHTLGVLGVLTHDEL